MSDIDMGVVVLILAELGIVVLSGLFIGAWRLFWFEPSDTDVQDHADLCSVRIEGLHNLGVRVGAREIALVLANKENQDAMLKLASRLAEDSLSPTKFENQVSKMVRNAQRSKKDDESLVKTANTLKSKVEEYAETVGMLDEIDKLFTRAAIGFVILGLAALTWTAAVVYFYASGMDVGRSSVVAAVFILYLAAIPSVLLVPSYFRGRKLKKKMKKLVQLEVRRVVPVTEKIT